MPAHHGQVRVPALQILHGNVLNLCESERERGVCHTRFVRDAERVLFDMLLVVYHAHN